MDVVVLNFLIKIKHFMWN